MRLNAPSVSGAENNKQAAERPCHNSVAVVSCSVLGEDLLPQTEFLSFRDHRARSVSLPEVRVASDAMLNFLPGSLLLPDVYASGREAESFDSPPG